MAEQIHATPVKHKQHSPEVAQPTPAEERYARDHATDTRHKSEEILHDAEAAVVNIERVLHHLGMDALRAAA